MSKVIVGIHGLANKPPRAQLTEFWQTSIAEGLQKNCGIAQPSFDLRMVYWADLLYKQQQHDDALFHFDKLYNGEPYTAGNGRPETYQEGFIDRFRSGAFGLAGSAIDFAKREFGVDNLADWVLDKTLKDLAFYYDDDRVIADRSEPKQTDQASKVLRADLQDTLLPLEGNEIMLIAHSMGTIIAYDVLRDIGQDHPTFKVAHFVTIGSPLGLPHVKGKIIEQRSYDGEEHQRVRTPSVVKDRWVNYADRRDPVALDTHLRDDYGPNASDIRVEDDLVANGYEGLTGKANHHKSYGYLRTPELSKHIAAFLSA